MSEATIHGRPIVARRQSTHHGHLDVVLVKYPHEYVTGMVSSNDPSPDEWAWGHYTSDFVIASADYLSR